MSVSALAPVNEGDSIVPALLTQVRRFCQSNIDSGAIDESHRIPRETLSGLGELGLFGLTLPEQHGGAGLSLLDACQVVETIAQFDRSVAVSLGLHLGLGTRGLVRYGTASQHLAYLPSLATGSRIAAFSTTEPDAGSDLSNLRTTGQVAGDELVINGRKSYVTNGGFAGLFTLAISTPGLGGAQLGQSLVLLEPTDSGFTVEKEENKLGLRGSSTTGLALDNVRVPLKRLLGEPGHGPRQLAHILSWGRTLMSAGCCGAAKAAVNKARQHVGERRQFGKLLGAQEVVRAHLASMRARHFAMEALVAETAREPNEDLLAAASLSAKVFSSEGAWEVIDAALQLHGGAGFIEETGLALMLRDVRVTRIFEGANDVLLTHLGTYELTRGPRGAVVSPLAQAVSTRVEETRQRLLTEHKIRVFRQPRLLHQLGTACMWRDALEASLRRAGASGSRDESALASAMAVRAAQEVERLLAPLLAKDAVEAALSESF